MLRIELFRQERKVKYVKDDTAASRPDDRYQRQAVTTPGEMRKDTKKV